MSPEKPMNQQEMQARQELAEGLGELDVDSFAEQAVENATAESELQGADRIDNDLRNALAELEAEHGGRDKMLEKLSDFGVTEDSSLTDILIAQEMRRNIEGAVSEKEAKRILENAYADEGADRKVDVAKELKDFKFHQAKNGFHLDVRHIGDGTFMIMAVSERDVGTDSSGRALPLTGEGISATTFKPETYQVLYNIVDSLSRDMESAESIYDLQQDIGMMIGGLEAEKEDSPEKTEGATDDSADDSPEVTFGYSEDSADDYTETTAEEDDSPEIKVA